MLFPVVVMAQDHAHWRFSGEAGKAPPESALRSAGALGIAARIDAPGGSLLVSDEVPHAFVYDPLTGRSHRLEATLSLRDSGGKPRMITGPAGVVDGSFTIEAIVANAEELPQGDGSPLTVLTLQGTDRRSGVELQVYRAHGYNWWGGMLRQDGRERRMGHERYTGSTHVRTPMWRHLAIVYDTDQRTATTYLDYTPLQTIKLDQPLELKDAIVYIGDAPDNQSARRFAGKIGDVRLTQGALEPWRFLRATPHDLSDVSFAPKPGILPQRSGYVDLRLRYGAIGDGKHDDTQAFKRAFAELQDRVPIEYHTLYIPEGTYLVSEQVGWTRFLIVQGAGKDKTTIRVPDNTPAFNNPQRPDAVVYVGWDTWRETTGKGAAGNVIGNYLFDVAIDTGRGNPGAVALSFHSNNHGAIENVAIRSQDKAGHRGLDFSPNWPGPTLIKNVSVEGFDTGIYSRAGEYSLVFENIDLTNQGKVAILNEGNILSIRNLRVRGDVPAISTGGWGMVTLIDSDLKSNAPVKQAAITNNERGALYVRNTTVAGYAQAIASDGQNVPSGEVKEFLAGKAQSVWDAPATTLNLPIEDAPVIPLGDGSVRWANVLDFAKTQDDKQVSDWADAIEAAFASGAEGVFFPANEGNGYQIGRTIEVPSQVRYLLGMRTSIGQKKGFDGPTLRIAQASERPVIFERLGVHGTLEHTGARVAVFRHGGPEFYQGRPNAGNVFVEDAEGFFRFAKGQKAWGRQMNPESHTVTELINDGADVWILGFKVEYATNMVQNLNGGRLEVLGGFLYPVTEVKDDLPMVLNQDATMSMIFCSNAYNNDYEVYFRDTQGGITRELKSDQLDRKGPRRQIHLYTSQPPGKNSAPGRR